MLKSFTMGFWVIIEDFYNSIWFWYLFDSSPMSMILLVRNNLKYGKAFWPWGVFLTGPVTLINGKWSFGLRKIRSRGTRFTEGAFLHKFLVVLLLQGWFLLSFPITSTLLSVLYKENGNKSSCEHSQ